MRKLFFFILIVFAQKVFSQCPFAVTLDSTGNCVGSSLNVNSQNSISKIVWYKENTIVKTAISVVGSDSGVTVAGGNGYGQNANQFAYPVSIFVDANQTIYVTDRENNRVQKWEKGASAGVTVAGGNGAGANGDQLNTPGSLFVDVYGNIYVSDLINNRVQMWPPGASSGITVAGGNGAGPASNQLSAPWGLFVDTNGYLYVCDQYNNRVQKFPPGSTSATSGVTVAGGNGPGIAANQLSLPIGLFVDDAGNIYVADAANYRVQKWDVGASVGVTVAGGNGLGTGANQLDETDGIYVDANGNVYVADAHNHRIQKWPPGATSGITIAGGNGAGSAPNQLNSPEDVFLDAGGNIYIADYGNDRIQKWASSTVDNSYVADSTGVYTAVVTDANGCTVTSKAIVINSLSNPGVTITSTSTSVSSCSFITFNAVPINGGSSPSYQWQINGVKVGSNSASFKYNNWTNSDIVNCIMTGNSPCAATSTATSNSISITVNSQSIVSLDSKGGTCLGDTLVVSTKDSLSQIIWYNGNVGVDTSKTFSLDSGLTVAGGNGGGAAPNQLNFPQGIFVDASGNLYVVDENNNRVQKWAPGATSGVTVAGGNGLGPAANQLNGASGIWVDISSNIYIADYGNLRVQKWVPGATSGITVAGGNGSGSATNQLDFPVGIYVDKLGNIYVADNYNNRVQKWAPGALSGITVAGGNGAGSAANQLNTPEDVFVDGSGNIYVLDEYNFRVQKWGPGASSGVTVAGGNGQGVAANQLNFPYGLYVDQGGNIYIGDSDNDRVQKWAPGATTGLTVAGGNGRGSAANQLRDPRFVYVDGHGNIYVSEDENGRVQKWIQSTVDTTFKPLTSGTYTAVVTNSGGCSATSNSIIINPIVTPQVSITASDTSICTGSVITFTTSANNGGANPKYQWQINGSNVAGANNATYISDSILNGSIVRCIFTGNAPCTSTPSDTSNSIAVTVMKPVTPAVTITASQSTICPGTSVAFGVSAVNAGNNLSYQWAVNGNSAGANNPAFTSNTLSNGDIVSCVMTSNAACATTSVATSNNITMNVAPLVTPSVTISASANNICSGTPVVFTVIPTNGGNAPSFQWMVNAINSGSDSPTFTDNALHDGDVIYCIMSSSLACTSPDSSLAVNMVVYPLPLVTFNPDTVYTSANGGVQLTPIITGTINQYQWSPASDLNNTTFAEPFASPSNEITYQLSVATGYGCTATGKVTVIAGRPLEIPNAFTPNGDGLNDIFRIPPGIQFTLQEIDIFDKLGNWVFTTSDITKGWDGSYHGLPAETGIYVYVITGKTSVGKPVFLKGTVALIR